MFISKLVKDRFEKQVIMMEQNGLDRWTYWFVSYLFDYLLYICVIVIVAATSLAFSMRLFTQVWSGEETHLLHQDWAHRGTCIGPIEVHVLGP